MRERANMTTKFAELDSMNRALAEATAIDAIKAIRDSADAMRTYAQAAAMGLEIKNQAAEIKLRAERKAGQVLAKMQLAKGGRPPRNNRSHVATGLQDLGISKSQSSRWQRQARISEDLLQSYLEQAKAEQREITTAGLLRSAERVTIAKLKHEQSREPSARAFRTLSQLPASAVADSSNRDMLDLLDELQNHRDLLERILGPLAQEGPIDLRKGERRAVGRLLTEIGTVIVHLRSANCLFATGAASP